MKLECVHLACSYSVSGQTESCLCGNVHFLFPSTVHICEFSGSAELWVLHRNVEDPGCVSCSHSSGGAEDWTVGLNGSPPARLQVGNFVP